MNGLVCDRCGKNLLIDELVRYTVLIRVQAAYDPLEITEEDLRRDLDAEMKKAVEALEHVTPEEAMNQVFREFRFDLCPPCQRAYLNAPLPR